MEVLMSTVINVLVAGGAALLSARLFFSGLHRRYRAFFLFTIFFTLENGSLGVLNPAGAAYQKIWVLTEPIEWFFYAWVVLELFSLVLRDYQGLCTVGRWSLIAATSVGLLASGFSLMVPSNHTRQGLLMAYYYMAERAIYFSLVVFLLTILLLLTRYPITLNRNTIIHSVVFCVYFLGNTAIFLLLSTRGYEMIRIAAYATQAINLGAMGTWLAMLNEAGERRPQRLRPAWMPGQEEKLSSQLNALNLALLRLTRS
jgi:hypothetical protein